MSGTKTYLYLIFRTPLVFRVGNVEATYSSFSSSSFFFQQLFYSMVQRRGEIEISASTAVEE
jgi:hypothetical protein